MKHDRKHSRSTSTRRRIAGAAATLSVLVGVVGLESGAGAFASSHSAHAAASSTSTNSVTTPTFSVSAPSNTTATVTWTNDTPTQLARSGTDSSGTGPWSTATTGISAAALSAQAFTFTNLIPGATYTFTLTNANGTTLTETLTQPGGTTFSVSAPSNTTATVTWTNDTPTQLARSGTDSSGTGPWSTATTGISAAALSAQAFTFTNLIPGATYTFTLTNANGTTLTETLTQPGGTTFSVSAPSNTTATVTWTNDTPTQLARSGTDSSGTGPWSTATTGISAAALSAQAFTFTNLIPGATYTFTLTNANGTTLTETLTQPGGTTTTPVTTTPVTTTPVTTPPVSTPIAAPPAPTTPSAGTVPEAPASLNAPTTKIFDDEFSTGSLNTAVWAPDWFANGSTQNNTVMDASNVSVGANGLNLTLNANGTGALVSSNPNGGAGTGFQVAPSAGHPVYVEYTATLPASGSQIANWPGLWLTGQTWPNTGEIDVMEGFGTSQYHIEYGPSSSQVSNPGGIGGTTAGTHTYGVLWTTTGVTFVYDGVVVGSETAALSGPMYLVMENSLGSPSVPAATVTVRDVRVWQ